MLRWVKIHFLRATFKSIKTYWYLKKVKNTISVTKIHKALPAYVKCHPVRINSKTQPIKAREVSPTTTASPPSKRNSSPKDSQN